MDGVGRVVVLQSARHAQGRAGKAKHRAHLGFLSGWRSRESLRQAFLMSDCEADRFTPCCGLVRSGGVGMEGWEAVSRSGPRSAFEAGRVGAYMYMYMHTQRPCVHRHISGPHTPTPTRTYNTRSTTGSIDPSPPTTPTDTIRFSRKKRRHAPGSCSSPRRRSPAGRGRRSTAPPQTRAPLLLLMLDRACVRCLALRWDDGPSLSRSVARPREGKRTDGRTDAAWPACGVWNRGWRVCGGRVRDGGRDADAYIPLRNAGIVRMGCTMHAHAGAFESIRPRRRHADRAERRARVRVPFPSMIEKLSILPRGGPEASCGRFWQLNRAIGPSRGELAETGPGGGVWPRAQLSVANPSNGQAQAAHLSKTHDPQRKQTKRFLLFFAFFHDCFVPSRFPVFAFWLAGCFFVSIIFFFPWCIVRSVSLLSLFLFSNPKPESKWAQQLIPQNLWADAAPQKFSLVTCRYARSLAFVLLNVQSFTLHTQVKWNNKRASIHRSLDRIDPTHTHAPQPTTITTAAASDPQFRWRRTP